MPEIKSRSLVLRIYLIRLFDTSTFNKITCVVIINGNLFCSKAFFFLFYIFHQLLAQIDPIISAGYTFFIKALIFLAKIESDNGYFQFRQKIQQIYLLFAPRFVIKTQFAFMCFELFTCFSL